MRCFWCLIKGTVVFASMWDVSSGSDTKLACDAQIDYNPQGV